MLSKCCRAPITVARIGNGSYLQDPGHKFDEHRAMLIASIESIFGYNWVKNEDFDSVFPEEHMYDRAIYGRPEMFANICEKCYIVENLSTNIKIIRDSMDTMINELIEYNWQRVPYDEDSRRPWPGADEVLKILKQQESSGLSHEEFVDFCIRTFKFPRIVPRKEPLKDILRRWRERD